MYYKFISRDLFPESWIDVKYNRKKKLDPTTKNTIKNYKRLGSIINDGRMGGLIDWKLMVDRLRELQELSHWNNPNEIVSTCAKQFAIDLWDGQTYRPECWIEKDALMAIFERVCNELDIPLMVCRGYASQTSMWDTAQRMLKYRDNGQTPIIFHFGDHDPSGKDMSRDICDRLNLFTDGQIEFERLALNMDQVERFSLPPNPAKITDPRAKGYIREFGNESWELDALEPSTMEGLLRQAIDRIVNTRSMEESIKEQKRCRKHLEEAANRWPEVVKFLNKKNK